MNDLTLRNVDGQVVAELQHRAEKTGRSVEQEAANLLRLGVSLSLDRLDAIERARRIRAHDAERGDADTGGPVDP